jgi:hypothetical protein
MTWWSGSPRSLFTPGQNISGIRGQQTGQAPDLVCKYWRKENPPPSYRNSNLGRPANYCIKLSYPINNLLGQIPRCENARHLKFI